MELFCVLVGSQEVQGSILSVNVSADLSINGLKKAIKEEKKNDLEKIDADRLKLYLAKKNDGEWLGSGSNHAKALMEGEIPDEIKQLLNGEDINPALKIRTIFADVPDEGVIHVLVVLSKKSITLPSAKRQKILEDLPDEFTSPSSLSKHKVWVKCLIENNENRVFFDRVKRPDNLLPLSLMNPVFDQFVGGCMGKIEIMKEDILFVEKLGKEMMAHCDYESDRADKFRDLFGSYLDVAIVCRYIPGQYQDDGSIINDQGLLIMNLEVKVERGENGDPAMQNIGYYLRQSKFKECVSKYEMPCLLLELEGPWLSVSGIINTHGYLVHETLSPPLMLAASNHCEQSVILMLASLKRAVLALKSYYNQKELRILPDRCLPYACSSEYVNIERKVFESQHRIVKFAERRYGEAVHKFCAERGYAPPLLSIEEASQGSIWLRVEMEKWDVKRFADARDPQHALKQLKTILEELQTKNFVHGDLRLVNLFLRGPSERVVLLDFDWAGIAQVNEYPYKMNTEVNWPDGARGGAKLDTAHDWAFYNYYVRDWKRVFSSG